MVTKKTVSTKKTAKKTIVKSSSKGAKKNLNKKSTNHPVEEKLNEALAPMNSQTESGNSSTDKKIKISEKKSSNSLIWGVFAVMLLAVFGTMLMYEYNPGFKSNFSNWINSTGMWKMGMSGAVKTDENKEKFPIKMRIVYNQNDAQQKATIEKYLSNVENNLLNTKVEAEWIDKNDQKGQDLINKLDAKFLPLFLTDESVKKHPQYQLFAPAINLVNGEMLFLSEGMEYLKTPEVGDAKYIGADPKMAKLVITEYASMTCGFCKMMHPVLEATVKKFPNVSVVIKDFDRGGIDTILSQAVECAEEQGKGKFNTMMTKMYDSQDKFFTASSDAKDPQAAINQQIKLSAKEAGLNGDKILACIKAEKYADKVKNSTLEGQTFGVLGTPSLFVGKKFLGGAVAEEDFLKIVNEELSKQ